MPHSSLNHDPADKNYTAAQEPSAQIAEENYIPEAIDVVCDELGSSHALGAAANPE